MSHLVDGAVTPDFAAFMISLAEAYGTRLSTERIRMYAAALDGVSLEDVPAAAGAVIRTSRYFPTVAEILQQVGPSPDDAAIIAWTALGRAAEEVGKYSSVEIEDGAAAEALEMVYGSWAQFCETVDDGPGTALNRAAFLACYRVTRRRSRGLRRLVGSCEASGAYPDGAAVAATWVGRVTLDGRVEHGRDRPQIEPAPEQRQITSGD